MHNLSFAIMAEAAIAAYTGRDPTFASRVRFWITQFGNKDITTLTTDDVEDGIDVLANRPKTKIHRRKDGAIERIPTDQKLAPASVNRHVAALGTVFRDLRRMRLLPRGFASPMRGVTRLEEGPGRTLTVTVDDVKRLVAAARVSRNTKLAALIAMACTTGWRKGTLQDLRWGAVDLKAGIADTVRTKNGTPHRTPLLPWVVDELRRIKPGLAADNDLVFGRKNFEKSWETALMRADLPADWTFHHCRHIAASILAQSGASTVTIMQALNHKTPLMAMRYSHLNVDSLRESVGRAWA
jgi:integrase